MKNDTFASKIWMNGNLSIKHSSTMRKNLKGPHFFLLKH